MISLERVVVPSPKIVKNLPRAYDWLPCKEEPFRFSGLLDLRNRQTDRKDKINIIIIIVTIKYLSQTDKIFQEGHISNY